MVTRYLLRMTIFCLCFVSAQSLFAQDTKTDPAAAQKAWMDYMTPGPAQKMLAEGVGEWKSKMKMWQDPSAPPMEVEGTTTNEMILGGRYLKSVTRSTMMGMPFEGWFLLGCDNISKEVTVIWYDNMGTGTMIAKGAYDKETKTATLTGTTMEPTVGKEVPFRETFKFTDKNNQLMEYFVFKDGKEVKIMEVAYSR